MLQFKKGFSFLHHPSAIQTSSIILLPSQSESENRPLIRLVIRDLAIVNKIVYAVFFVKTINGNGTNESGSAINCTR